MESPVQFYDFLMLAVLLGTTLFGAWKGMAWQLASLASVLVSAAVALRFSGPLAPMFGAAAPWNRFLAMLVLYLVTSLAIWLLFRLVAGVIDRVRLKEFDRQIGAMFGLFKGILLCVVITFFAVALSEAARQAILRSHSGRAIARLIERADPVMPEEVRAVLGKYIDELDRKLDPTTKPDQPLAEKFDPDDWLHKLEENGFHLDEAQDLEKTVRGRGEELGELLDDVERDVEDLSRRAEEVLRPVR